MKNKSGLGRGGPLMLLDRISAGWTSRIGRRVLNPLRDIRRQLIRQSEGEAILLQNFSRWHGRPLDTKNPQTFCEKLYCRMIALNRAGDPLITQATDKYTARAYVESRVGQQYLPKLFWHGEDPKRIPFDELPLEYVVKANHGCGQVIVVTGSANHLDIIRTASTWLKNNYYWACREYQYFDITPRVMIEEYLKNQDGTGPVNYKLWCFHGVPEVIHLSNYAHDINPFFDAQWNLLDLHYREGAARPPVPKPVNFGHMLEVASQLSKEFDFVRVDLYNLDGRIYVGELTFTPMAGNFRFRPDSWDMKLGEKWKMSGIA